MFGDGGAAHAEVASDASYALLAAAQDVEDLAARRIGEGSEDDIALFCCRFCNHKVTVNVTFRFPMIKPLRHKFYSAVRDYFWRLDVYQAENAQKSSRTPIR